MGDNDGLCQLMNSEKEVSLSPDLTEMDIKNVRLHSNASVSSKAVVDLTDDDDDLLGIHIKGIDDDLSSDLNIDTVPADELYANPVGFNVNRYRRSPKRQRQT